ncbi:hypothetical protein F5877DRAFT_69388 [Lentinula edodes]|nr:hypothetical protein F5877DRAFT_69388 [Lentinula edodes]
MTKSTGLVRLALSVMLAMTLLTVCLSMPISSTSAADGGAPTSALSPAVHPTPTAGSADSNSATASANASASAGADNGSTSASASSSSEADTSSASSSASSSLSADAGSASASASASSSGSVSASASVSSDNNDNGNSTAAASASTSSTAGAETGPSAAQASVKSLSSADSDSNSTSNAVPGSASPDSSSSSPLSSSSSPSFSASPATQNHDGVPPLMQPLAKTTKSENKTISDHQRWPSAVAAATIDGVVFPQTSKHPRIRAGQLSFMIGQKCKEMKENGYWSNVGDGLKKSFTVVPLILEAMVKTARN